MNAAGSGPRHVSVLPTEVIHYLAPAPGKVLIDATVGSGGHTRLLAERVAPTGRVIGLDHDVAMLALAKPRLTGLPVSLRQANFADLLDVLRLEQVDQVDGVLADLGICSDQLDVAARGFSFTRSGPLDMRMNPEVGESAHDLIYRLSERELADLFWRYGEERYSRRVAKRIVETRRQQSIETTDQLADLVRSCVPRGKAPIDPATRVFQALRIAVNDELHVLEQLLTDLPKALKPGGIAVLISFHSLEDRRVKQAFRKREFWEQITRKPVMADEAEIQNNPRARSAKLRAARRR